MSYQNLPRLTNLGKRPCAYVESWYDRNSRNWITQTKDAGHNQVGDASYSGNQAGRDLDHAAHVKAARAAEIAETIIASYSVTVPGRDEPRHVGALEIVKTILPLL